MKITLTVGTTVISTEASPETATCFSEDKPIAFLMENMGFSREEVIASKKRVEEELGRKLTFEEYFDILNEVLNLPTVLSNINPHGLMGQGNSRKARCEVESESFSIF